MLHIKNEVWLLLFLTLGNLLYAHVLETKLGFLEGVTEEARNKKLFHAYYGIPYAKSPVGKLRFEPPVPPDPWTGILNATKRTKPCSQINDPAGGKYEGVEDCLYAHVYTPVNLKSGSNVPVIVYINGGVFRYGDALDERGPEFLMSRDIIIVIMNYRLGVLGLLSTGDTVIPGNMALKDQTLAMKWTKENIYEFGGDPDRITLMGHSSGAMNAHLHAFSPLSEKYFHRITLLSGLGTSPGTFWDGDAARGIARAVAARVNCPIDSSEALKICLQNKTDRELVAAGDQIRIWNNLEPWAQFRPVIEDKAVKNAFLTENPLNASYTSSSKPMVVGMTSGEAAGTVSLYFHKDASALNVDTKLLLPIIGYFDWTSKPRHVNFITRILKIRFFGEESVNNETDITDFALTEMLTGLLFGHPLIDVVQKYEGLTYVYLLDYRFVGGFSPSPGGRGGRYLGVSHGIEMPIIFLQPRITGVAKEDFAFGDEMITRYINFAYTGSLLEDDVRQAFTNYDFFWDRNPNEPFSINADVFGAWSPVSSPRIEFLRMKRGGGMEKDYFLDKYDFWRKLPFFSKYE